MSLRSLAIRVVETRGMVHQLNLRALRSYIEEHTEEELVKEIEGMETARQLRALWEAGLSNNLQGVLLKRLERMR